MIVAKRAVLIALVKIARVFPEALLAFLAREGELVFAKERMIFGLGVAFSAIEPFPTYSPSCQTGVTSGATFLGVTHVGWEMVRRKYPTEG